MIRHRNSPQTRDIKKAAKPIGVFGESQIAMQVSVDMSTGGVK